MSRPVTTAAVAVLFFLSGAASLAYEVVWFRGLAHVWGSSALAASAVLASFLLGLGVGARILGRLADRLQSGLFWYGLSEVAIGLLAALVPWELQLLERAAAALYPAIEGSPLAGGFVRAALSFLVLGPPCVLMGGTFPLLVRELTADGKPLRRAAGFLYGLNTLGGAAGVGLSGFVLLPALGYAATHRIAVLGSIAAGMCALALYALRLSALPRSSAAASDAGDEGAFEGDRAPLGLVVGAAFLAGAASLLLQIAWTRQLTLILGGSTYAFSAMLFVVIAGIGAGGLLFHLRLRASRSLLRIQGAVSLALVAAALIGQLLIEPLTRFVGAAGPLRSGIGWSEAISFLAGAVLQLLPSIGMGLLLPLHAAVCPPRAAGAGNTAGRIYAWNTAGTIAGSLGGALIVLPSLGTAACVGVAFALYLLGSIGLFPTRTGRERLALGLLAAAGGGAVLLGLRGPDPLLTNAGLYLYGLDAEESLEKASVRFLREGVSASILVLDHPNGATSLRVNGKVDASTGQDMAMQLGLAYLPRFMNPEARETLVIGWGSGSTAGASLLFPDTRVTCAEIEPAVIEASPHFDAVNHKPLASPRLKLALTDGRALLQGAGRRFDLILSEPSNPWMAGVSSLFTLEFYRKASERLAPGGVLAQWIQAYSLTPSDYAMIARTVRRVFPHGALLRISAGDTILLASHHALEPAREVIERAQALVDRLPPVKADVEKYLGSTDVRSLLLSNLILGDRGLEALVAADGRDEVNTDLNLRLEFDAPRRLFGPPERVMEMQKSILGSVDPAESVARWDRWGCGRDQIPALKHIVDVFAEAGAWEGAGALVDLGLRASPDEAYFLAARFMKEIPEEAAAFEEGFGKILALSPEEATRIGVWLYMHQDYARSVRTLRRVSEAHPHSATLWVNLAAAHKKNGDEELARLAMEKARLLDPFSSFVREGSETLMASEPRSERHR